MNFQNCQAVYLYGSRVYGTTRPDSDWDYIVIKDDLKSEDFVLGKNDYKCWSTEKFQTLIEQHNISALECLFLSKEFILKSPEKPWYFKLDKKILRHSISAKSSHAWVKAKKKFISPYEWAEEERIRGRKSLFHSLRIISYGIQIARTGVIYDYACCNNYFEDIITDPNDNWDSYSQKWKPIYNNLKTQFRLETPDK